MIKPQEQIPSITFPLVEGGSWSLDNATQAEYMTLLVFYRGLHCPICKSYIPKLKELQGQYAELGVNVVVASSDSEERARQTGKEWGLQGLKVGYNVAIEDARKWGLYISKGIKEEEPEVFSEPGLYLIQPNKKLYAASIQTMPFTRPNLEELLQGLKFIKKEQYPARGEA